jgi:hypothetical protein
MTNIYIKVSYTREIIKYTVRNIILLSPLYSLGRGYSYYGCLTIFSYFVVISFIGGWEMGETN